MYLCVHVYIYIYITIPYHSLLLPLWGGHHSPRTHALVSHSETEAIIAFRRLLRNRVLLQIKATPGAQTESSHTHADAARAGTPLPVPVDPIGAA